MNQWIKDVEPWTGQWMLSDSAQTRHKDIQRQIGMDAPDYMEEELPGITIAMQNRGQFWYNSDDYCPAVANLHVTWTITNCLYFSLQIPEA